MKASLLGQGLHLRHAAARDRTQRRALLGNLPPAAAQALFTCSRLQAPPPPPPRAPGGGTALSWALLSSGRPLDVLPGLSADLDLYCT